MVQWLGLHTLSAGGPGSIPDQETRPRMPQLRAHMLLLNILCAAVRPSAATQINRLKKKRVAWVLGRKYRSVTKLQEISIQ